MPERADSFKIGGRDVTVEERDATTSLENADMVEFQITLKGPDAPFIIAFCAYARLHELERRRNVHGPGGFVPLPMEDELEYVSLRQWWEALGPSKQDNLAAFCRAAAKECHKVGGGF